MSQVGFGQSSSNSTTPTPSGIEYVDQTCDTGDVAVEDKLRVVGKKAVMHLTVDVWDTVGCETDDIVRIFKQGKCVYKDGLFYWAKEDTIDQPPSAAWSRGYEKCEILNPELNGGGSSIQWANLPVCV